MYKYAISTEEEYIKNKKIDYRFYLILLKNTKIEEEYLKSNYRVLNTDTFFEENKINNILEKMKIKKETFNKGLNNFLKTDLVKVENNNILLKTKSEENKYYQLLEEEEINKLIKLTSTDIKIYLIIKYLLQYSEAGYVKLNIISEKIGFNSTNNKSILKSIDNLKKNNLIDCKIEKSKEIINNKFIQIKKYLFKLTH